MESKSVRKFSWQEKKRFLDYESASNFKNSLLEDGFEYVKIRRCGDGGTRFKVTVGTPVKPNKTSNNKKSNKKENKNAN